MEPGLASITGLCAQLETRDEPAAGRIPASDQHWASELETARPGLVRIHRVGDARGNKTSFCLEFLAMHVQELAGQKDDLVIKGYNGDQVRAAELERRFQTQ